MESGRREGETNGQVEPMVLEDLEQPSPAGFQRQSRRELEAKPLLRYIIPGAHSVGKLWEKEEC